MTLPDKMTLDRLVRGDAPPDDEAWAALVAHPEAAEAWRQARDRRRRLDQVAAVARDRPWLAGLWLGLRRAGRRMATLELPTPALALVEPRIALASLGPEAEPLRRSLPLHWGGLETVSTRPGQRVAPALKPGERLLWRTAEGEGVLDAQDWLVEEGEGVVLLLAVRGGQPTSVAEVLAGAQPFAGLLLVPDTEGETAG
ncbi:MAG: hypothetical protein H6739_31970 [Alphaproteobacteria bacterium]|nr:hypothetical protein [Alphaproteobacteria bacterium]